MRKAVLATAACSLMLAGCSVEKKDQSPEVATSATTNESAGVIREEIAPEPAPAAPPPAPVAIQTQAGPKGYQVALNRARVTGDILTIALTYSGGECCAYAKVDDVSLIDDATSQRLGVLKDSSGKWMAGPIDTGGDRVAIGLAPKTTQVFFKFPAPPVTSKTVSLTIPEVAPFDAVPVTR